MQKIFVTGATGTSGQAIFDLLSSKEGVQVWGGSRKGSAPTANESLVAFDYTPATADKALQGIDALFMVTPFVEGMMEMEKNVIHAAKKAGVKKIVKLSVAEADAPNALSLASLHRELEKEIEKTGIPFAMLRSMGFMQNYSNYMGHSIKTQNAFYLPLGENKISFVDIRDVAEVAAKALTEKNQEENYYTLTGPKAISNFEVAATLSSVTGRMINYVPVSAEQARAGMRAAGMPDWNIDRLLELYEHKLGYNDLVTEDIEKITGHKPHNFAQFAEDYKDAFL